MGEEAQTMATLVIVTVTESRVYLDKLITIVDSTVVDLLFMLCLVLLRITAFRGI